MTKVHLDVVKDDLKVQFPFFAFFFCEISLYAFFRDCRALAYSIVVDIHSCALIERKLHQIDNRPVRE